MSIEYRDAASLEQAIREYAYFLWEGNGRPCGKDLEHWLVAEAEIEAAQLGAKLEIEYGHPRSWAVEVALAAGSE
jgi:hypothetical protein